MAADAERYVPVEPDGTLRDAAPNVAFMIHGLLSSRVEMGLSDDSAYEDDVNIYLAHLLCTYVQPPPSWHGYEYVSSYDSSVFEQVRHSTDARFKYTVYRANADHILMLMGIFHNPSGGRQTSLAAPLRIDDDTRAGRGKAYYDYASTYSACLHGRTSAITGVLGKLASGYERYLRLLGHLRVEYLNLIDRLGPGAMYRLERSVLALDLARARDAFLDAYAAWQRQPTPELCARLQQTAADLRRLDPEFRFELPEAPPHTAT